MSTDAAVVTKVRIQGIPGMYAQEPETAAAGIQSTQTQPVDAGREAALVQLSKIGQIIEYLKVLYR